MTEADRTLVAPSEQPLRATPYRHALVVANPIAGRGRAERAARDLVGGLRQLGVAAEVYLTRARGDARARLRSHSGPLDLVVSVGGDGSLREVLDGLVDRDLPVAMLPCGTANVLALDLGLPRDIDSMLEAIRRGKTVRMDLAKVNGHLSFMVTGIGFDARVVRELESRRKGSITRWSYVPATLRALSGYRAPQLRVEVDGRELEGTFGLVLIANVVHYAGVLKLARSRTLDDGCFELYAFRRATPLALARSALRGLFSELPGGTCTMIACRRARVSSSEPVPYQVDGDWRGETPVEFEVLQRRVRILIP